MGFLTSEQLNVVLNILTLILGAGGLGIILKYRLGTRKLDLDSEEAIRDHYAKEVAALRQQMLVLEQHYRNMLDASDRRHEDCQIDRDRLRDRVRELEKHVEGLERQISQYSADRLIVLERLAPPSESAPHSLASAHRIKDSERGD